MQLTSDTNQPVSTSWQDIDNIDTLARFAIETALASKWKESVEINSKILKLNNNDLDALKRIARAFACLGKKNKAAEAYKKVLEIDPYSVIAKKNLEKLSKMSEMTNGNGHSTNGKISSIFLFEPGKTKAVNLLNLAPPAILASVSSGDKVEINTKRHAVHITSNGGTYLGALPDDLAHKLITFIEAGNRYETYVKSATTKGITVLIREISRCTKYALQPSFQDNRLPVGEKDALRI